MINVLFVCLGNICRSPMAEGVFQQMVNNAGLADKIKVDSAGTGSWHVGETAHRGTRRVLKQHGIPYDGRARQITTDDMERENTYIIALDSENFSELEQRFGRHPRCHLLLDFAEETAEKDVPDPYYTGNFEYVYQLVTDGCRGLLKTILQEGI
ncbi:MAG: low molecular weight protein-tyrosine-phosphatase [Candidatus Promineifilaceae bacterium]